MLSNSVSVIFFFSSRRRHTRCLSDWSSDVCSSDLCYHKEWDYFSREYGIPCIDYIEPKPGIPPTPRSEERRVGKECRDRRSPEKKKKKNYEVDEQLSQQKE